MHDALFTYQHALADADLARYAQEIGLDVERIERELSAHAPTGRIQEEVRSGRASGGQGTPAPSYNGERHMGGFDRARLRATIAEIAAGGSQAS